MEKEYFLGLDMGTGSLGWAVTNTSYEVIRKHGKALWGVRLFESANTAEERRTFRTNRRRLKRRNWRISILQSLLEDEINKIDNGFLLRLKESRYVPDDKRDINGNCPVLPYSLFVDKDYSDKEYHKEFPTIYHLRNYLMKTNDIPDIRLVYLALSHIMKHRGHFLFSGNIEKIKKFDNTFMQLINTMKAEELDFNINVDDEALYKIENILKDKNTTKSSKKSDLIKILGAQTICEKEVLNMVVGGKVKLSKIFGNSEFDSLEKADICFSDANYDEYAISVQSDLGELYAIIAQAKAVYDWAILVDILGDYNSISEAKIALYEKHKKDLRYLKNLIRNNCEKEVYNKVFVTTKEKLNNYSAYIGMTKYNGKKQAQADKMCSQKDFYDFLKKDVLAIMNEDDTEYLREEIEKETFLPRQVTKDNSVLPYQVNLYELEMILNNLEDKLPVLKENKDKIIKTFTFRIPYYVGPLNGITRKDNKTNWAVRRPNKNNEKILPWNFEDIIDIQASAEQFIRRMTNKCTYLINEDVLPKNSLLYSKFMVLNELNNVRINGELLEIELKQNIYNNVFKRYRKVTQKKLKDYLVREGVTDRNVDITGVDGDFKGSLTAYHDFKEKLTGVNLTDKQKEEIVLNITLFGEDKKLLSNRLHILYPEFTEKQIKSICSLSYNGWGRLSDKFLEGITAPAPETGDVWTIIQALWESQDNLMQILSDKYLFYAAIDEENGKNEISEITYELVDNLYVSPAVKRQIWQTLQTTKEICKIMGNPPAKIFVEMAREKQDSIRTVSRKRQLIDLYKKCRGEEQEWISELVTKLNNTEENTLRGDKLYLYYTQKGRCMYSGERIKLEDLWDNHKYDIDHIYPQSKIMDDSLDNRVLVKREINADKTDVYPLNSDIRNKMHSFWKSLLDGGFISKEKYKRLTRASEFEPEELAGFIQRQLVETRQSTKAVASVLKQIFTDTEVIYVKAKIASKFRQDFDIIKVREMNDLHHAKDAYLNIVVGNAYNTKFTQNAMWYIKEHPGRSYNLQKLFMFDIGKGDKIAWKAGNAGTIVTVKNTMNKNNILVTRRSYEKKGGLFDQMPMKKGKGQVPFKGNDERLQNIDNYGGYNKATGAYFMLVSSIDKKGNRIKTIEYIPLYLSNDFEKHPEKALAYLSSDERGLREPEILISKIKIDTLFKVDGFYMWLSGRMNEGKTLIFKSANQFLLDNNMQKVLKKVINYNNRKKDNNSAIISKNDNIKDEVLINLYDIFVDKLENTLYKKKLSSQLKTLISKRAKFVELSLEDKCIILYEVLHMFQCNSIKSNLKLLGGSSQAGTITLGINITNIENISIINQSITGVFEKEINLGDL